MAIGSKRFSINIGTSISKQLELWAVRQRLYMTRQMGYSDVIFDIDSITVQNFITSKSHICFPPVFGSFGFAW